MYGFNSKVRIPGSGIPGVFFALMSLVRPIVIMGQIAPPASQDPAPVCKASRSVAPIPPNAEQVAGMLGILPMVHRVRAIASGCSPDGGISLEEATLRQQITEKVLAASLDIHVVLAEIDSERAQIADLQERLLSERDDKVSTLALYGIITGSGSNVAGAAMQFGSNTVRAGSWITAIGGAGGIALSILALRQKAGEGSLDAAPNMLAPLFGRTPDPRSEYPPDVWTFLTTAPANDPGVQVPWRDQLIAEWVRRGRIASPGSPEAQQRIDKLTSRSVDKRRLSHELLTDRRAMLADLRARVTLMSRDLRDLMKAALIPPATSPAESQQGTVTPP